MHEIDLFNNYENAKLQKIPDYRHTHPGMTYTFDSLQNTDAEGVPICLTRNGEGKLEVTFAEDTHLLAIGATRSGKTTGFVIPTINIMLSRKNKPSLVISDPKQELYHSTAEKFKQNGYRVLMLDFTNYRYSDCWNPLLKYYRMYKKYLEVEDTVETVRSLFGSKRIFMGEIYDSQKELDYAIREVKEGYYDEIEKGITALTGSIIPTVNTKDPFWDDSARDLLCAILYGMLEDIETGEITEKNFSFDTVLRIFESFSDERVGSTYDGGYFTSRPIETSKAHQLARKCIIEQATTTRRCICSEFASKMNKFKDTSVRRITCTNTFEISELDGDKPTVIFVSYKDEEALHYDVISMFLTNLYTGLIELARTKNNKLQRPFYFLLDEFGNLPAFNDFEKVISACGGRNIWFLLVLQSYAQLNKVYGQETAEIIKDNLNMHIFFGTNNPETKQSFSEECGKQTVFSPTSALNGNGETIEKFEKETVSLVPVSTLTLLPIGRCYVTRMRENTMYSSFERSYTCPEFKDDGADPSERLSAVKFCDPKYNYSPRDRKRISAKKKSPFVF